ncbi:DNAse I-like superfamily protein [Dorcoceras hygrometricum]|uniref:DNAse I-like superfamily protein n=1 Tax=Dorcoceras hygrometricum TaxID=472368 RepID=A0A2Z7DHS6_9LAMI|nr:DNAse I-like superfamily protein [Dorcoceras hygrometricum]
MMDIFNGKVKRLCSRLGWPPRRGGSKPKITVKRLGKSGSRNHQDASSNSHIASAVIHPSNESGGVKSDKSFRVATFNAALFSMAPAVPRTEDSSHVSGFENQESVRRNPGFDHSSRGAKLMSNRPKSILKQSPLHPSSSVNNCSNSTGNLSKQQKFSRSRLRVSINLPDNEISLTRSGQLSYYADNEQLEGSFKGKAPLIRSNSMHSSTINGTEYRSRRAISEVLKELNIDVLALQDVKAEEEKNMKPLSDLADALGMKYVFAESWAPEYGNAILSKWPIKRWKVQKVFDDSDFRNVLKATIDVPQVGEVNFFCTHLDHLDENWRMKQINAIIQSTEAPHILAGGLNSLDETDYSQERWTDIAKYYEEMRKPTPKVEVMKHLKSKQYTDAKDFAGECESVVMIAKGQSVQGTCKYGTRVDYILSSSNAPYKFVPGSYSVLSSKGTSDHHIVKVDVIKVDNSTPQCMSTKHRQQSRRTVKITHSSSPSKGVWKVHS